MTTWVLLGIVVFIAAIVMLGISLGLIRSIGGDK
jgi:hypothetical protein